MTNFSVLILVFALACNKKDGGGSSGSGADENDDGGSLGGLQITATLPAEASADTAFALTVTGSSVSGFSDDNASEISAGQLSIPLSANQTMQLTQAAGGNAIANGLVIATVTSNDDKFAAGASMKFVEVPVAAGGNLLKLPTESLKDDASLDLGTLNDSGGDFVATQASAASIVDVEAAVLNELSSTDNGLKLVRNAFMNGTTNDAKYMHTKPQYMFTGDLTPFATSANSSAFTQVEIGASKNTQLRGFLLRFEGRHDILRASDLCRSSEASTTPATSELLLIPPTTTPAGEAQTPELVFNGDFCAADSALCPRLTTLTSQGAFLRSGSQTECYSDFDINDGNYFVFSEEMRDGALNFNMNWASGYGFLGVIPEGLWDMKLKTGSTETLIARFDLAAGYPMSDTSATAYPVVYIPSLKLTRDTTTNKLLEVAFKMNVWNAETNAFVEVSDISLMQGTLSELYVMLGDSSTTGWSSPNNADKSFEVAFPASGNTFTVDTSSTAVPWILLDSGANINNDESTPHIQGMVVTYELYGVTYRFDLRL